MNQIPDDSFVLDKCKAIADILRSRYGAWGHGLGQLANSVEEKLPISAGLALRRIAVVRNKVIKDRERFPITVFRDKIDRNYFDRLASELINSLQPNAAQPPDFLSSSQGAQMVEPLPITESEEETVVSIKRTKPSCSKKKKFTPEETMSNPHYRNDLSAIDGIWDLARVASSETVFILSGCNLVAELLDRPVAEMLRDEIDRLGDPTSLRRAIVISDFWWAQEAMSNEHPVIAIGGPSNNGVTREILEKVEPREINGLRTAFAHEDFPRVAVWGDGAEQTKESVEHFIHNDLEPFLKECWH